MTFEAIKQCAINHDLDGLNRLLSARTGTVSIDVRKTGTAQLTPAGELAREGNLVAVEFLKQHGASVNGIAYGLALGGHTKAADRYRTAFGANPGMIAHGFAMGGHVADADKYHNEFGDGDLIAMGFAQGGYIDDADRYRDEFGADVDSVAMGFARGGHKAEAKRYHEKFGASVHYIARGFALCGNVEEADRYHTVLNANVDDIVRGFAQGGYTADADRYHREFNADVDIIAQGFAQAGYVAQADRYRTMFDADVNKIASGFALGGHTAQASRYHILYGASVDEIAFGFSLGGHTAQAQRYRAMMANHPAAPEPEKPTTAESLLKEHIDTCKDRPITIIKNFKYPEKFSCPILLAPPSIPVRILGFGPFDYHSVMKIPETKERPGIRRHPLLDGVTFEIRDIAPDTVTRDALNSIALAFSKTNAVSGAAQVAFGRNADNRAGHKIEPEKATRVRRNSI